MSKITPSQLAFIEAFVELGDATKAYKVAGYAGDRSNAHRLVQRLSSEINQRLQSRMAMSTSVALQVLEDIMTNEDNAPRDRLNAVSSWLDRAGVARASTVQVCVPHINSSQMLVGHSPTSEITIPTTLSHLTLVLVPPTSSKHVP